MERLRSLRRSQGPDVPATQAAALSSHPPSVSQGEDANQSPEVNQGYGEQVWPREARAYTSLTGCFFLMFNSWGLVNAYGTFSSYYMQHLLPDSGIELLNLIGATECFLVLALSGFVGRLLDAGYFRWLTGVGAVLVTLGMFMLSLANGPAVYEGGSFGAVWATQGLLMGLGMACLFVSSSQIAATWFKQRRSFAIGIVSTGASIAGLIYPITFKYLITILGFNDAVRCVGAIVGLTSIAAFLLAVPNPTQIYRPPKKWLKKEVWVDSKAFHNRPYCWFVAGISIVFLGYYAVFFNLEEWASSEGFGYKDVLPNVNYRPSSHIKPVKNDAIRTFYLLAIMNASSTVGRLGSAYLSDHFGALSVHAIVTALASLLVMLLWTLTTTVRSALAFVILFGIVSGAVIGLPPAAVAHILGQNPEQQAKLGQWTGMMYMLAAPWGLIGPIIPGHLVSKYNSYLAVQLWSGTSLFLGSICMCVAIWHRNKEVRRQTPPEEPSVAVEGDGEEKDSNAEREGRTGQLEKQEKEKDADTDERARPATLSQRTNSSVDVSPSPSNERARPSAEV